MELGLIVRMAGVSALYAVRMFSEFEYYSHIKLVKYYCKLFSSNWDLSTQMTFRKIIYIVSA